MVMSSTTNVNQQCGYLFGAVYALVGVVGFLVTAGVGFAATQGNNLSIFELNPLNNVIHLAVGALFIVGARMGERTSRQVNLSSEACTSWWAGRLRARRDERQHHRPQPGRQRAAPGHRRRISPGGRGQAGRPGPAVSQTPHEPLGLAF